MKFGIRDSNSLLFGSPKSSFGTNKVIFGRKKAPAAVLSKVAPQFSRFPTLFIDCWTKFDEQYWLLDHIWWQILFFQWKTSKVFNNHPKPSNFYQKCKLFTLRASRRGRLWGLGNWGFEILLNQDCVVLFHCSDWWHFTIRRLCDQDNSWAARLIFRDLVDLENVILFDMNLLISIDQFWHQLYWF